MASLKRLARLFFGGGDYWNGDSKSSTRASIDPFDGFTKKDFNGVALDMLWGKIPRCDDSYFGGSLDQCDKADLIIQDFRAQYAAHEPRRLRREIMGWLDWYQRQTNEARADLVSGKHRKEMERYERERCAERNGVFALKEAIARATPTHPEDAASE